MGRAVGSSLVEKGFPPKLFQFHQEVIIRGQQIPLFRSRLRSFSLFSVTCLNVRRMTRGQFREWWFGLEDQGGKGAGGQAVNSLWAGVVFYISCIYYYCVMWFKYPAISFYPHRKHTKVYSVISPILQIRKLKVRHIYVTYHVSNHIYYISIYIIYIIDK